jgi:hypothetical protein
MALTLMAKKLVIPGLSCPGYTIAVGFLNTEINLLVKKTSLQHA